jgi:hypothetical protein
MVESRLPLLHAEDHEEWNFILGAIPPKNTIQAEKDRRKHVIRFLNSINLFNYLGAVVVGAIR